MPFEISYFHARVLAEIESWPVVVVLHAFIKKTQATPAADLALARQRMKELSP